MSEYAKKIEKIILDEDKNKEDGEKKEEELNPATLISSLLSPKEEEADKPDKVIAILFEHPDLRKISDITPNELIDITVLATFAQDMKVPLIDYFLETRLALALSKNRKSREEIVEIYKTQTFAEMGMFPTMDGGGGTPSRWERLKGRFGM